MCMVWCFLRIIFITCLGYGDEFIIYATLVSSSFNLSSTMMKKLIGGILKEGAVFPRDNVLWRDKKTVVQNVLLSIA